MLPIGCSSGISIISSGISTECAICTSFVSRCKKNSFISAVVPSARVNEPTRAIVLPFSSTCPTNVWLKFRDLIPASSRVISSSGAEKPSPSRSTHIRNSENLSSFASMTPSRFESNAARAAKPLEAVLPSSRIVLSPNNSLPVSICPFASLSNTSMPDLASIQPVFSEKPLLSRS